MALLDVCPAVATLRTAAVSFASGWAVGAQPLCGASVSVRALPPVSGMAVREGPGVVVLVFVVDGDAGVVVVDDVDVDDDDDDDGDDHDDDSNWGPVLEDDPHRAISMVGWQLCPCPTTTLFLVDKMDKSS